MPCAHALTEVVTGLNSAIVAGAAREVAAAQSRVADKERLHYDSHQATVQQTDNAEGGSWKEAAQTARQLADAMRATESAHAAQQQAENGLRLLQLEVARLKVYA